MSTDVPHGQVAPPTADPVYEVPDDAASEVVADSISKSLLSSQIRAADKYNDKSRNILQQCIHLLPLREQRRIEGRLNTIGVLEDKLESNNSWFRKALLIMEYQHVSKKTYYIVKRASNQYINNQIRDRIRGSTPLQARDDQQPPPPAPPPPPSIPAVAAPLSHTSNPDHSFRARGRSALDSASFHDVDRVDLTTLQSSKTGDSAVLLELHTREQRTLEYVATLQPTPPDDNMTDGEGEISLNTHDPAATEVSSFCGVDIFGPPSDVVVVA